MQISHAPRLQFMELWLLNDGYVQRLAELSQDQFTFQDELLHVLRREMIKEKEKEMMQNVFLGVLEWTILTNFDPRGDETLVALQGRLAQEYVPHNLPDSADLSPLLEIFKESAVNQSRTLYSRLWSEILSANAYDKFKKTDLKDQNEVKRLGRGVRNLFLRDSNLTVAEFEELFGKIAISPALKSVYGF